jgi:hypothetical protein
MEASARMHSSLAKTTGSPFFCGIVTGASSAREGLGLPRGGGSLVRLDGERVLLLAGDAVLLGDVLGRVAHRLELEARGHPRVRVAPAEGRVVDGRRRALEGRRRLGIEKGARVMLSTPPAITHSASPSAIMRARPP